MISTLAFHQGDGTLLAQEYNHWSWEQNGQFEIEPLSPQNLVSENALAVHFAEKGAQGQSGLIRVLSRTPEGTQVFHGKFGSGKMDLTFVAQGLPMLTALVTPRTAPLTPLFPLDGEAMPCGEDWEYRYVGAGNHYFARKFVDEQTRPFLEALMKTRDDYPFEGFEAVSWFYMAKVLPLFD